MAASKGARRVRITADESRLVRLGVVYADPVRLTIHTELFLREMSPKQFFDEVGGHSYDSVRKHFKTLEEYGWIRRVRKRSDGLGRRPFVYRTTELAVIDEKTWAEIPLSIQDAFTVQLMQQISERLGLSLEAGCLGFRGDDVFSLLSPLTLDERGWRQGLKFLGACFRDLEQEQIDAKVRLAEVQRPPIQMIVALAGFESSASDARGKAKRALTPSTLPLDTRIPWTLRIAKVFGDPILLRIVRELHKTPMSASQLERKIGGFSVQTFDRRCKILMDLGWIEQVDEKTGGRRRGSRELFYSATSPAVSPDQAWDIIPLSLRSGETWEIYRRLCELAFKAVQHGTLNTRVERHLTWVPLLLDEIGWQQVTTTLKGCTKSLSRLEREAKGRISANNRASTFTFFVGGFESPVLRSLPLWGEFDRIS